jgi:hypothetical protein
MKKSKRVQVCFEGGMGDRMGNLWLRTLADGGSVYNWFGIGIGIGFGYIYIYIHVYMCVSVCVWLRTAFKAERLCRMAKVAKIPDSFFVLWNSFLNILTAVNTFPCDTSQNPRAL